MSGGEQAGVTFPVSADNPQEHVGAGPGGGRPTALARVASQPRHSMPAGRPILRQAGYLAHFRRLIEAGLTSRQAAVSVARDGLASLHQRMRVAGRDGTETGLGALVSAQARHLLTTVPVTGGALPRGKRAVGALPRRAAQQPRLAAPAGRMGRRRASSSRPAQTRPGPSPRAPSGSPCPAAPSWCSGRAPRSARCRCC